MADGNMGSLWFQLGLKDNTSKELQKIIDKLKTGDDAANALLRALQGFGTKKSGFKEQAEKAKEFSDVLLELNRRISKLRKNDKGDEAKDLQAAVKNALSYLDMLQKINIERSKISELRSLNPNVDTSKLREAEAMLENVNSQLLRLQGKTQGGGGGGVDQANVLQDYSKVLQMTLRDVKQITDQFKKENPLSAFSGGAAKVEADIARVTEKLAKMRDLMSEGAAKGYNTSMLGGSLTELDKVLSRLQAASGNKSILTDAAQMKNLLSDVAVEMTKATSAMQAYGREKGKVIAVEREFAAAAKLSAKDNEAELKAQSDYIKRYMALVEKKREFAEKGGITLFQKNDQGLKNITAEIDVLLAKLAKVREDITLYQHAIGNGTKESIAFGQQGLKEANAEAEKLMSTITALQNVYDTLRVSQANVKDLIGQTPQRQRQDDIQKRMSEYYSNLEKTSAKEAAQATRDAAKAKREDIQAEKQRQNEIEITKRRIQSLAYAMENLQGKVNEGQALKIDTSKAEVKIKKLEEEISVLRDLQSKLEGSGWKGYLGSLGQYGNGRSTREANHLAQEQAAANREAQKGVEIEQKRQAEIAKSAAKVQSDLVRGFERANSHAGKLNSTVQDLKSLFLQGGLVFGAQQFAMSIITTGGEMEKQHIALQSILGDMQNANTMFNQIKELALNSPFTFSELNRDVKQLAAYGVEYDQLYDTTKRLADMSSGLGVSFDRIALAFGQVQARGWLDGKELRQIAYAGIPLLNKLSEFYSKQEGRNVSTSEIKTRISNRDVSFDDVKSIFWQMTNEGGQFYNMQQTLSETLLGRYNKLKDAWEIMLADFANGKNVIGSTFKDIIELVTNLVQSIHTIGPAIAAVFAGPLLKKGLVAMEGGLGKSILTSKAGVASDITSRVMQGQKISAVEKQILATKNQITLADIKNLARANALTKVELQRLYISGRITKEMYQQGMSLTKQTQQSRQISLLGAAKNLFSGNGIGAAGGLLLGGLKSIGSSILGFFGGLPGIAISAGMSIFAYYQQKNAQLKQEMDTTADELKNRYTNISEFLRDNDADKALNDGDEKNIENLIDAYKEKLKEIAPEKANAFEMSLTEKKSNEDRLRYLKQQLELLKKIEAESNKKLSDEDAYKGFDSVLSHAKDVSESYASASAKTNAVNATQSDFAAFQAWSERYKREVNNLKSYITDTLGDISKDPKLQGEANQIMSSFFSKQGWDQNVADQFRADVLNSMGVETNFYEEKFKSALENAVNTTYPWIGDKIRNNQELTDAEKVQVNNLMKDAAAQVERDYPLASDALKRMLAADRFEAVIHLVFDKQESDLVKQLGKNLKGDGYDYHEKNKIVGSWGNDAGNSYNKAQDNAKSDISSTKKELEARRKMLKLGNLTLDEFNETQKQYDLKVSAYHDEWGEWFTGEDGKKGRKKGGRKNTGGVKADKALADLRKRIDLYKKMYAEIKKFKDLYGNGALGQLANDGEFEAIFGDKKRFPISDYTNYETSIKELLGTLSSSTQERKDYKANEKAGIQTENRKLLEDARKDELNTLNKQLSVIQEQYDTYKKLYELTGNKRGAENVAFGGLVEFDSYRKYLEEQLDIAVKHDNIQSGLKLSTGDVKGMSLDNIKDRYGEESRTYDIKKQLDDENKKIKSETINLMADLIEKNATIEQQIEDENRKYERQLELIKGIEDPQMRQRAQEGAEKTHNETTAKLQFEQFKETSDWVRVFDDLDRVSTSTIESMIGNIDEFSKKAGLSVDVVKQLREALGKLRDEKIERNPIEGIVSGMQRAGAIGDLIRSNKKEGVSGVVIDKATAGKTGLKEGKYYSNNELKDEKISAYKDANKGINALVAKFKALQDCLDPVIGLFDALGMEDTTLGQGTSMVSGALGAGAQVANGLSAFGSSLSSLGPYGAAAGAALSVATSIFAMHDKALQKEIEASEARQKEMENLTKNVKSVVEDSLGGVYSFKATESMKSSLRDQIANLYAKGAMGKGIEAIAGSKSKRGTYLSEQEQASLSSMKDALNNPDNAYLMQKASLNAQLTELKEQQRLEESKKKSDDTKIADYKQQIIEMEQQIDTFKEDFLKDVYSIDMKSWASELTDAVVGAWEKGENAVDAYKDKVKDLVKDLTKNILTQSIVEKALQGPLDILTDYLDNHDGKLDEGVIKQFAQKMNDVNEKIVPELTSIFDALKGEGLDLRENGSSSTSNSVQGITEETADLLSSYVNSMRADLSMVREMQGNYLPEMSEIAKSQLAQLNLIAQNTLRNADAAERIEAIFIEYNNNFNRVLNGTKSLKMK